MPPLNEWESSGKESILKKRECNGNGQRKEKTKKKREEKEKRRSWKSAVLDEGQHFTKKKKHPCKSGQAALTKKGYQEAGEGGGPSSFPSLATPVSGLGKESVRSSSTTGRRGKAANEEAIVLPLSSGDEKEKGRQQKRNEGPWLFRQRFCVYNLSKELNDGKKGFNLRSKRWGTREEGRKDALRNCRRERSLRGEDCRVIYAG